MIQLASNLIGLNCSEEEINIALCNHIKIYFGPYFIRFRFPNIAVGSHVNFDHITALTEIRKPALGIWNINGELLASVYLSSEYKKGHDRLTLFVSKMRQKYPDLYGNATSEKDFEPSVRARFLHHSCDNPAGPCRKKMDFFSQKLVQYEMERRQKRKKQKNSQEIPCIRLPSFPCNKQTRIMRHNKKRPSPAQKNKIVLCGIKTSVAKKRKTCQDSETELPQLEQEDLDIITDTPAAKLSQQLTQEDFEIIDSVHELENLNPNSTQRNEDANYDNILNSFINWDITPQALNPTNQNERQEDDTNNLIDLIDSNSYLFSL